MSAPALPGEGWTGDAPAWRGSRWKRRSDAPEGLPDAVVLRGLNVGTVSADPAVPPGIELVFEPEPFGTAQSADVEAFLDAYRPTSDTENATDASFAALIATVDELDTIVQVSA